MVPLISQHGGRFDMKSDKVPTELSRQPNEKSDLQEHLAQHAQKIADVMLALQEIELQKKSRD